MYKRMLKKLLTMVIVALGVAALLLLAASGDGRAADGANKGENETCLACHGDKVTARRQLIYVDRAVFSKSIHAKVACADCHVDAFYPHAAVQDERARSRFRQGR
ncbi:MAG: hypothetical protein HY801_02745 [Candidatus Lindowbacteria bacterium]|nr:hypothetical protein [Candidatus Lindowbacteria bacterium]